MPRRPVKTVKVELEGLLISGPASKVAGAITALAALSSRAPVPQRAQPTKAPTAPKQGKREWDDAARKEQARKIKLGLARRKRRLEKLEKAAAASDKITAEAPPKPLRLKPAKAAPKAKAPRPLPLPEVDEGRGEGSDD